MIALIDSDLDPGMAGFDVVGQQFVCGDQPDGSRAGAVLDASAGDAESFATRQ